MAKCLAKAQMEAELDNALKQLELETRKCINRRLKKSGIDKNRDSEVSNPYPIFKLEHHISYRDTLI